ncbi:hypothetical protein EYF80_031565 [Liparis tanakae]|uniref:Uncharacterized protein n=1 Tax=Liparis tanakae TaxID=230148 RepID=A0A4Z2GYM8_9TELE|nr:hypothetical protein EYF80_031565 [Liparis tanakae]
MESEMTALSCLERHNEEGGRAPEQVRLRLPRLQTSAATAHPFPSDTMSISGEVDMRPRGAHTLPAYLRLHICCALGDLSGQNEAVKDSVDTKASSVVKCPYPELPETDMEGGKEESNAAMGMMGGRI